MLLVTQILTLQALNQGSSSGLLYFLCKAIDIVPLRTHRQSYRQTDMLQCSRILISSHGDSLMLVIMCVIKSTTFSLQTHTPRTRSTSGPSSTRRRRATRITSWPRPTSRRPPSPPSPTPPATPAGAASSTDPSPPSTSRSVINFECAYCLIIFLMFHDKTGLIIAAHSVS